MMRIPRDELDYPGDGVTYYRGARFTGIATCSGGEGWVESEEEYDNGMLAGIKREWHRPGVLSREAECRWGGRHGLCREWDEVGNLVAESTYEFGVRVAGKRWDPAGVQLEDFRLNEADPAFHIVQAARAARETAE